MVESTLVKFRALVPASNSMEFTRASGSKAKRGRHSAETRRSNSRSERAASTTGPGGPNDGASTRAAATPPGDMRTPRPVSPGPQGPTVQPGQAGGLSGIPGAVLVIFYQKREKFFQ